jgi:glyoxylase-like metal-dependent hydrolase (beta-lactamase superfamily II)
MAGYRGTRALVFIALLFLGVASSPAHAQLWYMTGAEPPPVPKDSTLTIRVQSLAPGVYAARVNYVWTGWVELSDGLLVIDAAMADSAGTALADTIRARSPNRPFRYLVVTNAHEDHIRGARPFLEGGATLVAPSGAHARIDSILGRSRDASKEIGIGKRKRFGDATRPVDVVWFGRPAVSRADLAVYLPKQKVLFTGDLASHRAVPWLLDRDFNLKGWRAALDSLQLSKRYPATTAVPGHGLLGTADDVLQFTRRYLLDAEEKAKKSAEWSLPLAEIKRWGDLGAYEGLEFYDEIHFMNMRRLYNEAKGIKTPGRGRSSVVRK